MGRAGFHRGQQPGCWISGDGIVIDAVRISYYVARGRRIILLTVFRKQRRREQTEIDRAERTMTRCIEQAHDAEDESDG